MAKASKVSPILNSNISNDDDDNNDDDDEDDDASLLEKGQMIHHVLYNDKNACANFLKIISTFVKRKLTIEDLEACIDECYSREREYAEKISDLEDALEEQQATKESLEETFSLELSKVKESHDRNLVVANYIKIKNDELKVAHPQLKASYSKELAKLPSNIAINNDACATNSISCEASTLKENVELRAQLEWLTSNYGKLEESNEKLSSSHYDLLISHDKLKLAHKAIITKVTSCEPHVDNSTTTQNVLLTCASPSNSSKHDIATSCDELLSMPCCSNN
jgi:hypothetical protein